MAEDRHLMIPRVRELLHATPFEPFAVRTIDRREYIVATADHAAVHPKGGYMFVFGDDESTTKLSALHIAALVENGELRR
jgi:hypothetical protein